MCGWRPSLLQPLSPAPWACSLALLQEVESLDIIFYDQHLQNEQAGGSSEGKPRGSLLATLIDIQMEFVAPYGELRGELKPPKVGCRLGWAPLRCRVGWERRYCWRAKSRNPRPAAWFVEVCVPLRWCDELGSQGVASQLAGV